MPPFRKSTAREYFESIVIAVILALFVRTWVVQAFKIPTGSMEQNLLIGDHLLVNKFAFGPTATDLERALLPVSAIHRGDVVGFTYGPVPVPADSYFMMGDNRDNSQDSRYWGFLPRSYVKGKALMIYWSYEAGREDYRE